MRALASVKIARNTATGRLSPTTTMPWARIQHQAHALGGPIAALDAEEGALADAVNIATVGRSWDLWKRRVMG
jgi:hypothetical protein